MITENQPTIIASISSSKHSVGGRNNFSKEKQEYVMEKFGMLIPTHVHFYLTPTLIEKMKNLKAVLLENGISNLNFISSTRKDNEHSYVELYHNEEKLNISTYDGFNKLLPTFEKEKFMLELNRIHSTRFQASFLYVNEQEDFEFHTEWFDI